MAQETYTYNSGLIGSRILWSVEFCHFLPILNDSNADFKGTHVMLTSF